ncbi:UNVERIFIED_CONTAM: hypothetical protein FKN15_072680 [Acipenser sinensis]
MEGSGDIPGTCTPDVGLLATWRWSKNAKEQVHLKQKIKDLPALLKHGLHLRKKTAETVSSDSLFPPVDKNNVFEDANAYYQFSYEECDIQDCPFRNEQEWHNGVQLLMQLVPYVQFRIAVVNPPEEETEDKKQLCNEVLQMKALERLTSTPTEGAVVCGLYTGNGNQDHSLPVQPGAVCTLHDRDDISRIEMVQRLAKDSCRFLQTPNIKVPDKTFEKQKSVTMVVSNASLGQPLIQDIIYFSRGILIK